MNVSYDTNGNAPSGCIITDLSFTLMTPQITDFLLHLFQQLIMGNRKLFVQLQLIILTLPFNCTEGRSRTNTYKVD